MQDPEARQRIRLVAIDVDGTLVVGGRVVSPELEGIFAELGRRGVAVALCTGRLPHHTVEIADALGVREHLVCTEGGLVLHRPTGEKLHYATLPDVVVARVAQAMAEHPDVECAGICDDVILATGEDAARRSHWWGSRREVVGAAEQIPSPVLVALFGPHGDIRSLSAALQESLAPELALIHPIEEQAGYGQLKVCSPGADKGVAAERLARHLGSDLSGVLAFGDYLNDLGIMRAAGHSICPREAHPLIRRIATRTSPYSAAEGFVARELTQFFGL